jgi:Tfp pilus assembly protein PilW
MVLVSGAYLTMISVTRQTQGITAGIDNLSFALETIVRTIRTNKSYSCSASAAGVNCPAGSSTFSILDKGTNSRISYTLTSSGGVGSITQTIGAASPIALTDSSINVTSLQFYANGTPPFSSGDRTQAQVIITASGRITSGPGKFMDFTVETSATMRDPDTL